MKGLLLPDVSSALTGLLACDPCPASPVSCPSDHTRLLCPTCPSNSPGNFNAASETKMLIVLKSPHFITQEAWRFTLGQHGTRMCLTPMVSQMSLAVFLSVW